MAQFGSEWVGLEVVSCCFLVFLRGGIEYGAESRERDGCAARIGHCSDGKYTGVVGVCSEGGGS